MLDKVRKRAYDYPVITLDNPKGRVPPKGKVLLKVGSRDSYPTDESTRV